jgi:hypothetical protein
LIDDSFGFNALHFGLEIAQFFDLFLAHEVEGQIASLQLAQLTKQFVFIASVKQLLAFSPTRNCVGEVLPIGAVQVLICLPATILVEPLDLLIKFFAAFWMADPKHPQPSVHQLIIIRVDEAFIVTRYNFIEDHGHLLEQLIKGVLDVFTLWLLLII